MLQQFTIRPSLTCFSSLCLALYTDGSGSDYMVGFDNNDKLSIDAQNCGNEARMINDYRGTGQVCKEHLPTLVSVRQASLGYLSVFWSSCPLWFIRSRINKHACVVEFHTLELCTRITFTRLIVCSVACRCLLQFVCNRPIAHDPTSISIVYCLHLCTEITQYITTTDYCSVNSVSHRSWVFAFCSLSPHLCLSLSFNSRFSRFRFSSSNLIPVFRSIITIRNAWALLRPANVRGKQR